MSLLIWYDCMISAKGLFSCYSTLHLTLLIILYLLATSLLFLLTKLNGVICNIMILSTLIRLWSSLSAPFCNILINCRRFEIESPWVWRYERKVSVDINHMWMHFFPRHFSSSVSRICMSKQDIYYEA